MTGSYQTSQQPLEYKSGTDFYQIYVNEIVKNGEMANGLRIEIHTDRNYFFCNRAQIKEHLPTIQKHLDDYTAEVDNREKILLEFVKALQPILKQHKELLPFILSCKHELADQNGRRPAPIILTCQSLKDWAISIYKPKDVKIFEAKQTCLTFDKTLNRDNSLKTLQLRETRAVTLRDFIPLMICLILMFMTHYAEIKNGK